MAPLAQLVAQQSYVLWVGGSSPPWSIIFLKYYTILVSLVGQDSRFSPDRPGFKSRTRNNIISKASLAQLGERQTEDLKVPGSIPGGGTHIFYFTHTKYIYDSVGSSGNLRPRPLAPKARIMPLDH